MRKQARLTLILSFHTTAAAMETERVCAAAGIPGRLLPAPRQLTADCGIAWASDPRTARGWRLWLPRGPSNPPPLTSCCSELTPKT